MYPCGEVYMAYVSSGIPLIRGVKVLHYPYRQANHACSTVMIIRAKSLLTIQKYKCLLCCTTALFTSGLVIDKTFQKIIEDKRKNKAKSLHSLIVFIYHPPTTDCGF